MKSTFRATAILSGGSVTSILLSLISAKVMAVYLHPAGYGYYGLLQSFLGLMVLLSGMGIGTGLVRAGAGPAARNDEAAIASLRRGAWLLFAATGGVITLVVVIFRVGLSQWALGNRDSGWTIVLMCVALLFMVAANIQVGILNAYHRVTALAKYGVVNTLANGAIIIPAVFFFGIKGVVPGIIASAVATWLISRLFLHHEVGKVRVKPAPKDYWKSFRELIHFGVPFTASQLVGTGVQLALPIVVLHMLGTESVGYYRAALGISVGYLGFLITAMGQDYYPRLSAVHDSKEALVKLINEQHRLVMILAVPVILGTLALVPFLVPLVYSLQFGPTVAILEWQMIGDIFKFSSWTMSFAILARCGGTTYFLSELLGGIANVAVTWVCVKMFGLSGLGIGFLGAYILYYFIIWAFVRHELPLKWTSGNIKMMLGAVGAALVVRILPATRFAHFRTPVALAFALVTGVPSLFILWREFMVPKEAPPSASGAAPAPPVEVSAEVHSSVD